MKKRLSIVAIVTGMAAIALADVKLAADGRPVRTAPCAGRGVIRI